MLGIFMPRIYRNRRRAKRQLARQHRQQQQYTKAAEKWDRSGDVRGAWEGGRGTWEGGRGEWEGRDSMHGGGSTLVSPKWNSEGEDDMCPVFDPTCPVPPPPPHPDLQHNTESLLSQRGGGRGAMSGIGGMVPPPHGKESSSMWMIMPIYTAGIVVLFVYTIMRVLLKKAENSDRAPMFKDFGLDPEYRKYVLADEYLENADTSTRDQMRRQQREGESRARRNARHDGSEIKPGRGGKMDTKGKKLGEWYLPEGFMNECGSESDESDTDYTIGGTTVKESALETLRERLLDGLRQSNSKSSNGNDSGTRGKKGGFPRQMTFDEESCKKYMQQMAEESEHTHSGKSTEELRREVLEGSFSDENISGSQEKLEDMTLLDYMYSDEFLENLKNGLKRCNTTNMLDADNFEDVFCMIRDYIVNKRCNDTLQNIHTDEQSCTPDCTDVNKPENDASVPAEKSRCSHSSVSDKSQCDTGRSDNENVPYADPTGETEFSALAEAEALVQQPLPECDKKDELLDHLRRRLEETERAMKSLVSQMDTVTDKLTVAKITKVLSQAQEQARILKENEENLVLSKGSSPDMDEYEVITKEEEATSSPATHSKPKTSHPPAAKSEDTKPKNEEIEDLEEEEEEQESLTEEAEITVRKRNVQKTWEEEKE